MINWDLAGGPGFFIFFQEEGPESGGGYPDLPINPVIIYESLPVKTVERVVKKVKKYKAKKVVLNPEAIEAIVESMVDVWSEEDMRQKMEKYRIDAELAIVYYKATLRQLILDDDLALILILASI